jgi:WD40 repeat protein
MKTMPNNLVFIKLVVLILPLCVATFSFSQGQTPQQQAPPTFRVRAVLRGHTKSIDRIAFSPDGKQIATSSEDSTVRIWDTYTGELKETLSGDGKAQWEQKKWYYNWQHIRTHEFPDEAVGRLKQILASGADRLAISPDKCLMITVRTKDPEAFRKHEFLELWDVSTGELKLTFAEIPYGITEISWSTDGKSIVVEGDQRTKARLMDVVTGRVKAKLPYEACSHDQFFGSGICRSFTFNADGSVFTKEKNPLRLWSADTGELLAELKSARHPATFSPTDKNLLVTTSTDEKAAMVWELVPGSSKQEQ